MTTTHLKLALPPRVSIGISACLLGDNVRYDGGNRRESFFADVLEKQVAFVRVCPEIESGLSAPREPMNLFGNARHPRLITLQTGVELTRQLRTAAAGRVAELTKYPVSGFIFKSRSPSCGLTSARVYQKDGTHHTGAGLFASAFANAFKHIPLEEEDGLQTPAQRAHFLVRVVAAHRFFSEVEQPAPFRIGLLEQFHAQHKYQLLAHHQRLYRQMGPLVANAAAVLQNKGRDALLTQYRTLLFSALRTPAEPGQHANVLQHIIGYFKTQLTPAEREEFSYTLNAYLARRAPLIAPIERLQRFVSTYKNDYLARQTYLYPVAWEIEQG